MKVLIIEDEPAVVELYKISLQQDGFEVIGAYNGEKGLELASNESPDLILLDIMMPEMNGIQVLEKLKKEVKTTKKILPDLLNYYDIAKKIVCV